MEVFAKPVYVSTASRPRRVELTDVLLLDRKFDFLVEVSMERAVQDGVVYQFRLLEEGAFRPPSPPWMHNMHTIRKEKPSCVAPCQPQLMGEEDAEDVYLGWAEMFSDEALQPTDTVKYDEKGASESNLVVIAGMKFSSSERTLDVMASAAKFVSDVLEDIAHKNAGVDRSHLQSLQEGIAIQVKSNGARTDKVKALVEVIMWLMDGLNAVENAASALKDVSTDLGPMQKLEVVPRIMLNEKTEVTAGDFKFGFEEDNDTLVVRIENVKHTLENEYATVFVQLRQASQVFGDLFFARDFFCILTKNRKCALSFSDFDDDHPLEVSIRPVAVTLPDMLNVLAECFEAKKRVHQSDDLVNTIIVAKDATKKKLIAEINKLRDNNKEKGRLLEEAHAEIEVLKEQLKGWQEEVIGISERIKLKAMPGMRRVVSTSNVSTSSTATFSDFETIHEAPASDESTTNVN